MKSLLKCFVLASIVFTFLSCGNNDKKNVQAVVAEQGASKDTGSIESRDSDGKTEKHTGSHGKPVEKNGAPHAVQEIGSKNNSEDEDDSYTDEVDPKNTAYYAAYNKTLKLWNTSLNEKIVKTSLGNAHLIICGPNNGEPVVLLHGMNASSTMWYPNIEALSRKYRVYAIDNILEPGKSKLTGDAKDMQEVINWYIEVLRILDLKDYTLIGASKGGWLSTSIAMKEKWRIKNLILLSPAQTFIWIPPGSEILSNITYKMSPDEIHLNKIFSEMSFNSQNIEKAFLEQYYIGTKDEGFNKFILQMRPYHESEIRSLSMPVLLLIGDHDIINNQKSINKAKRLLPRGETGIIKNAGHFLSIDQSETVNNRMLDFMEKN